MTPDRNPSDIYHDYPDDGDGTYTTQHLEEPRFQFLAQCNG